MGELVAYAFVIDSYIEINFVEVAVGVENDIHVVEAGDLMIHFLSDTRSHRRSTTYVFVTTEVVQEPEG